MCQVVTFCCRNLLHQSITLLCADAVMMMMLRCSGDVVAMETKIPPLTPRTRQKMSQAVLDTFRSFDNEQQRLGIPKGI